MTSAERPAAGQLNFSAADCKRLAEAFSYNHRRFLGRGPDWVGVAVDGDTIIVESRGVLTALEKTVAREPQNHELVRLMRDKAVEVAVPSWQRGFPEAFGLTILAVKSCLDIASDSATLFFRVAPVDDSVSTHTG